MPEQCHNYGISDFLAHLCENSCHYGEAQERWHGPQQMVSLSWTHSYCLCVCAATDILFQCEYIFSYGIKNESWCLVANQAKWSSAICPLLNGHQLGLCMQRIRHYLWRDQHLLGPRMQSLDATGPRWRCNTAGLVRLVHLYADSNWDVLISCHEFVRIGGQWQRFWGLSTVYLCLAC